MDHRRRFTPEPHPDEPALTIAEKTKVAVLIARMAKRGLAAQNSPTGDVHQADLKRKVERILDGARRREKRAAGKTGRK
ncbi:hypothetical protein GCM10010387_43730 [Streptomyces inusitatus]|uniref:Uncharacterized protein n=1 Tax=Streptomyces inusitatus TaxID=68221 RepID=A0A918QEP3_9ACTN|nr:DUF6257 family protein [Streptomyces inusitatus]GGZ44690.1 hypothetical protein GCM10010387_43730 [Streptomyces inusitatus]